MARIVVGRSYFGRLSLGGRWFRTSDRGNRFCPFGRGLDLCPAASRPAMSLLSPRAVAHLLLTFSICITSSMRRSRTAPSSLMSVLLSSPSQNSTVDPLNHLINRVRLGITSYSPWTRRRALSRSHQLCVPRPFAPSPADRQCKQASATTDGFLVLSTGLQPKPNPGGYAVAEPERPEIFCCNRAIMAAVNRVCGKRVRASVAPGTRSHWPTPSSDAQPRSRRPDRRFATSRRRATWQDRV